MTVNLSARQFSLIIAGVDRTHELKLITLSQPSTLERRVAPISGTITLVFNPLKYNEYITIGSPAIAANWAVGVLIVFQTANDSEILVNNLLSGAALYILKEPSPPNISFGEGTLQLEVGDILTYENQRTPDRDVSGVPIGTLTDRDEIVIRVLKDAGIDSYSIPSLNYPFYTPVQKTGGTPIDLAGDLVGADRHVLYCNSSGTVIASPIDLDASPIATLTVGQDELSFEPVDGSSIPTVTELVISGICQIQDKGDYPILVINENLKSFSNPFNAFQISKTTDRSTIYSISENLFVSDEKQIVAGISIGLRVGADVYGFTGLYFSRLYTPKITVKATLFDTQNRLSKVTETQYQQSYLQGAIVNTDEITGTGELTIIPQGDMRETGRKITEFVYHPKGYIQSSIFSEYTTPSVFLINNVEDISKAILFLSRRETTSYTENSTFWVKAVNSEGSLTADNATVSKGLITKTININGEIFIVKGFNENINPLNPSDGIRKISSANDGSTRPPSITYSEKSKTKNLELKAIVNALPLAGVPSKDKLAPITVDWMVSNEQAYEYGKLEIVLMNGRKQCRFMITALTDQLLALRPRCRIDIIFRGILYRCLVDGITFSQSQTERSIGFMCDVISTSPADTPSTVYQLITPISALRGLVLIDAITSGTLTQTFDIGSITIDAVTEGVLAEQGQTTGDVSITANIFGTLSGA